MNYAALDLLPQRPPFQFVDDIISLHDSAISSLFTVTDACPLLRNQELSESALLEIMAQTVAAGNTLREQQANQSPKIGFIGAIKKVEILGTVAVGMILETHIQVIHQVGDAQIVEGRIKSQDSEIARAELTIFVQEKNPTV